MYGSVESANAPPLIYVEAKMSGNLTAFFANRSAAFELTHEDVTESNGNLIRYMCSGQVPANSLHLSQNSTLCSLYWKDRVKINQLFPPKLPAAFNVTVYADAVDETPIDVRLFYSVFFVCVFAEQSSQDM